MSLGTDCDDTDPAVHPGAAEVVGDPVDRDCDGIVVCWVALDHDGFGVAGSRWTTTAPACLPGDGGAATADTCDDHAAGINPVAVEDCDGVDNDCDQEVDGGICGQANAGETDGDGVDDALDLCPAHPTLNTGDQDGEGIGDACDNCPFVPTRPSSTPTATASGTLATGACPGTRTATGSATATRSPGAR